MKLAAPVCGRILAALVIASVLVASCGGGGGTPAGPTLMPVPVADGSYTMPIVVDAGPVANAREINVPYVSVTVCIPGTSGTTAGCQTIDHVLLDTGSSGLRLLKSELYSNLNLPPVTSAAGAVGECMSFVVGTTWGSVRYADIYLGGEVAKNVPIQDIGDAPGGFTTVPYDCSNSGTIQDTQAQLGSNGILGVGLFKNDCDACISPSLPIPAAAYYTCTANGCANSDVTATQVVQNPVADFALDNNGVQINLPAVPSAGANTSLTGSLTFGIGTQTNNGLGIAQVFATDQYGNIVTTYQNVNMTSFIDSGSNALFFNDPTSSLNACTVNAWAYCPTQSQTSQIATNTAASGVHATTGTVNFSLADTDSLGPSVVAANIGGFGTTGYFDWGLPFFFGKSVFTAIQGMTPPAGVPPGPYFAY